MDMKVYRQDGSEAGRSVTLDAAVFDVEPNDHAIWLDVRAIQAHARQGTHKAKERSEVSGSTRKLYRQKGTGNARAGDVKSPVRVGGGRIFGPRPHTYELHVNKKTKQVARRSALTYKAREEALRVVEDFGFEAPSTKQMAQLLKDHTLGERKVLVLTAQHAPILYKSGRNLRKLTVRPAAEASTLDLLDAQVILLQEGALEVLTNLLGAAQPAAAE